jgi:fructose-1,6-bisphosphatase/inositol monophosphatase family enzyme
MLNKIIEIAKEAGQIVREGFGKTINIEFKTNESNLVTQIDKASEKKNNRLCQKRISDSWYSCGRKRGN